MRGALAIASLAALAASSVRAQSPAPPPPEPASRAAIAQGLFGEDEPEPGDEDVAAGRVEPPRPAPTPGAGDASDARVRSSFAAAEAFQGPLEGGWTLTGPGAPTYLLRFADHAGLLEGVWSDPRRSAASRDSGPVEVVARTAKRLTLRFTPDDGATVALELHRSRRDAWTGRMRRGGRAFAVRLLRTSA